MKQSRARHTLRDFVRPVFRHPWAAVGAFLGTLVIVLLIVIAWQPRAGVWRSLEIGLAGAVLFSLALAHAVERMDPCFRTRDEVERVLGIPVLASYPPPGER
jgi:hypothetical protein